MRQITENRMPCEDEFAILHVEIDGDDWLGIVVKDGERHFFLSDVLDGSPVHRYYGFHYSWVYPFTADDLIANFDTEWSGHDIGAITIGTSSDVAHLPISVKRALGIIKDDETSDEDEENSFISDGYETTRLYRGMEGYHSHHGGYLNKPTGRWRGYRIGIECEVEFHNYRIRDTFTKKSSNWFYCERDGSLDSDGGCEIITIPLLPKDAKSEDFWEPLTSYLDGKCDAWDSSSCGLHVHIGREILGRTDEQKSETIGRLLYMYHHWLKDTRLNTKIFGRLHSYNENDGKTPIGDAVKLIGSKVLNDKEIAERVKHDMTSKSSCTRYFDVNLTNEHTIEFRKGRGTINPRRIAMLVEYCEKLCIYAKATPWQQISYDDFVNFISATAQSAMLKKYISEWR